MHPIAIVRQVRFHLRTANFLGVVIVVVVLALCKWFLRLSRLFMRTTIVIKVVDIFDGEFLLFVFQGFQ